MIERKPIVGTPFQLTKIEDKWYITMGDYQLTEGEKTEQKAMDNLLWQNQWNVIATMTLALIRTVNQAEYKEAMAFKKHSEKTYDPATDEMI